MSLWRWEEGRQGGEYSKLLLARSKLLKFDLFLLRLPRCSMVRHHRDPAVEGHEHHRVNIALRTASTGGETFIATAPTAGSEYFKAKRAYHFRPDLLMHYVRPVMKGEVWLLSFGWLRKSK